MEFFSTAVEKDNAIIYENQTVMLAEELFSYVIMHPHLYNNFRLKVTT
jgi:hypothetical protein